MRIWIIQLTQILLIQILAPPIQQEETCIERESRDRVPTSKLQSAIYYALDGDHVNILILLAQRGEDPWVKYIFFLELIHSFLYWNFFRMVYFELGNLYYMLPAKGELGNVLNFWLKSVRTRYTFSKMNTIPFIMLFYTRVNFLSCL